MAPRLEAGHVMSLTRYLARCSGLEDAETRAEMQSCKSLVINTLYLLRLVHQAAGERDLAVLNKLRDQVRSTSNNTQLSLSSVLISAPRVTRM